MGQCYEGDGCVEAIERIGKLRVEGFYLSYNNGKAVQEILNRYLSQLRNEVEMYTSTTGEVDYQGVKDIDYIEELAKLFD